MILYTAEAGSGWTDSWLAVGTTEPVVVVLLQEQSIWWPRKKSEQVLTYDQAKACQVKYDSFESRARDAIDLLILIICQVDT